MKQAKRDCGLGAVGVGVCLLAFFIATSAQGACALAGAVYDEAGLPIPRATVMLFGEDATEQTIAIKNTDSSGRFEFENMPADEMTAIVEEPKTPPGSRYAYLPVTVDCSTQWLEFRPQAVLHDYRVCIVTREVDRRLPTSIGISPAGIIYGVWSSTSLGKVTTEDRTTPLDEHGCGEVLQILVNREYRVDLSGPEMYPPLRLKVSAAGELDIDEWGLDFLTQLGLQITFSPLHPATPSNSVPANAESAGLSPLRKTM